MNKMYGFEGEVRAKLDSNCMDMFAEVFRSLPLAVVVDKRVLVVHGGLFQKDGVTLEEIAKIDRFREPPESGLMSDILWSDPQPFAGRGPSKRGACVCVLEGAAALSLATGRVWLGCSDMNHSTSWCAGAVWCGEMPLQPRRVVPAGWPACNSPAEAALSSFPLCAICLVGKRWRARAVLHTCCALRRHRTHTARSSSCSRLQVWVSPSART
jgi:hypothetical protein